MQNHAFVVIVIGDTNADLVAELPAHPPRELVVPSRVVLVLDDIAWPVAHAVDLDFDRQIRAAAEEPGNFSIEMTGFEHDAIVVRLHDSLRPAKQFANRLAKS